MNGNIAVPVGAKMITPNVAWVIAAIVVIIVGVRYAPKIIIPAVGLIALYIVLHLAVLGNRRG